MCPTGQTAQHGQNMLQLNFGFEKKNVLCRAAKSISVIMDNLLKHLLAYMNFSPELK